MVYKRRKKEGTQKEVGRPAKSSNRLLHSERNTRDMENETPK